MIASFGVKKKNSIKTCLNEIEFFKDFFKKQSFYFKGFLFKE